MYERLHGTSGVLITSGASFSASLFCEMIISLKSEQHFQAFLQMTHIHASY